MPTNRYTQHQTSSHILRGSSKVLVSIILERSPYHTADSPTVLTHPRVHSKLTMPPSIRPRTLYHPNSPTPVNSPASSPAAGHLVSTTVRIHTTSGICPILADIYSSTTAYSRHTAATAEPRSTSTRYTRTTCSHSTGFAELGTLSEGCLACDLFCKMFSCCSQL